MVGTLSIRLGDEQRAVLEKAARAQGKGLSAYIRELAEAEARRVQREAIHAEGRRVVAYLTEQPCARAELEELGTPQADIS